MKHNPIGDPEVEFAARLGVVLAEMREQLDPVAIKRVLTFALERWGIQVILGLGLTIGSVPVYEMPPDDDHGQPWRNEA